MKYLKLFEEMKIDTREFVEKGHDLSTRERKILTDLVGGYLHHFYIKVEDHYYYTRYNGYYNRFENFNELKDYILSYYYTIDGGYIANRPEEYLELLKRSNLDPSFDNNWPIRWATSKGHTEIVKHLLKDSRVDPCVEDNRPMVMRQLAADDYYPDGNWSIWAAHRRGHKEIVKLLLNDERVRSKLTEEEINKYTNEIS